MFGVRLIDFFADREPWGEFWRLLDSLGSDSRYRKAMLDDPEQVAGALAQEEKDKAAGIEATGTWHPDNADWSTLHELVAGVWDRQGAIAALLADLPTNVKHRHTIPPAYPRPVTELDRQRKAREKAREQAYDDRLMGAVERAKQRWREQNPDAPPPGRQGRQEGS